MTFEKTFPQDSTGEVTYAGVLFGSAATMRVVDGVLHATAGTRRISLTAITARAQLKGGLGLGAGDAVIEVPGLEKAFVAVTPILGETYVRAGRHAAADRRAPAGARQVAPRPVAQLAAPPARLAIQKASIWGAQSCSCRW